MSSSETLYWHDYETSGTDPAFDRPLQFAGVRTNADFEVVGAPLLLFARPTPDFLPHPAAVAVTGITPQRALAEGVSEAEFIHQIHAELAVPGTCTAGYNSIRFDDEFTRFTLFRNFFDPYAREYANGNSRWDLIDVVRAVAALRPAGTAWPTREQGGISFRLEDLTAANDIAHGAAHDALSDVMATIGLARHLRAVQPELVDTLFAQRRKRAVQQLLDFQAMTPVVHVSGMFGAARGNLALVVPLAPHPVNANEVIVADLARPPTFLDLPPETVREQLFTPTDALPVDTPRPGLKTLRLNRAPVLLPATWVRGEPSERLGLDGDVHRRHLAALRDAARIEPAGFRDRVQAIFADARTFPPRDPEAALYEGFLDDHDRRRCDAVRRAAPDALGQTDWRFSDPRLAPLLFRYRARNHPDTLDPAEVLQWQAFCRERLLSDAAPFPLAAFDAELAAVRARDDLSPAQRAALDALDAYAKDLRGRLG